MKSNLKYHIYSTLKLGDIQIPETDMGLSQNLYSVIDIVVFPCAKTTLLHFTECFLGALLRQLHSFLL